MEQRLEALRQRQEQSNFLRELGVQVASAGEDGVECCLEVHPGCISHLGFAHAGALYTLAENAAGAAAFHRDGRRYVTQGGNIHYLGNRKSGLLRARARVIHAGRSTCLVRSEVTDGEGRLLCTGEFSFFCVEK